MTSRHGRRSQARTASRACRSGKVRYRGRWEAERALAELERMDDPKHLEQRAYACPWCGGFHLTKQGAA